MVHAVHDHRIDLESDAATGNGMMTHPRRYALRMAVFLVAVAVAVTFFHADAGRFFMRNPPLNTLILTVLAVGIGLSFRTVQSLAEDVARLDAYRLDRSRRLGMQSSLLGPLAAILQGPAARAGLTATAMRSVLDGIDSRLDERRDTSRYLIALLIFLGLLGTFWGLLLTATSVGETIRSLNVEGSDPAEMFATLRAGLEAPLSGMGTAFSTSLFGLASSLVLGFLDLQASQAQSRFASELETWLAGSAGPAGVPLDEGGASAPAYLTALLEQASENLDKLERRMERAADESTRMQQTLHALGDRLGELCDELRRRKDPGTGEETMRTLVRSLEDGVGRIVQDAARGRDRAVDEMRSEIRLLAKTLAALVEREVSRMGRARSRSYRPADVWPGYVDALTTLLLTIMFLLTVYVLAQFFLSQALSGREKVVDKLSQKIAALSKQLAGERKTKQELQGENTRLSTSVKTATDARDASEERAVTKERQLDELSAQITELQAQLRDISAALGASQSKNRDDQAMIADLGGRLQAALAEKVAEMARYRSEFFGRLKEVLGERRDVRVVGDRFVFQSEVLFPSGSADLSPAGRTTLTAFARTLLEIAREIPAEVSWVLRVDGHTDRVPIKSSRFPSNWELSTARALSVVKYLIVQHVPAERLAAAGFGEFQPLEEGNTVASNQRNRRIEMRLTDR